MKRREFLGALGAGALAAGLPSLLRARPRDGAFLVPMDASQPQPLRAYGLVYRALRAGGTADWLLEHRGGAFLVRWEPALDDALERGVWTESAAEAGPRIDVEVAAGTAAAVRLEVAPRIAVYAPPYAAPWDDAVRLALEYAGVPYRTLWDREILRDGLADVDWLHLHHEDFTGQYGKYGVGVQASDWYRAAVTLDRETAGELGFADAAGLKTAVAGAILRWVEAGGFMFAMCAATETFDLALAGPDPTSDRTLAFTGFQVEEAPVGPFSTIDGHRVNTPGRRALDAVELARFAPGVDPVAAMLTQNHAHVFADWYGLTTSFHPETLRSDTRVLATCGGGTLAKYVHGERGGGSFTFLGGHDPEDAQHAVGDPPTDLARHPRSPGYRLILNNVLFPAAEREEKRT